MRELHVVGLSPDGRQLLLAVDPTAARASHAVTVDGRLQAALRGERHDEDGTERPTMTVKDMQARLRTGATVEEVAVAAGVPASRVERFAGPVRSELERVLQAARAAVQTGRRGVSAVPLGEAVAAAVAQLPHLRPETVTWSARRRADNTWVVRLGLTARGRERRAEWALDEAARHVTPLDPWAAGLGHVAPAAPPRPAPPRPAAARGRAAGSSSAGGDTGRGPARPSPSASAASRRSR